MKQRKFSPSSILVTIAILASLLETLFPEADGVAEILVAVSVLVTSWERHAASRLVGLGPKVRR